MDIRGITWKGESIDDVEIPRELPADLVRVLGDTNGFILYGERTGCSEPRDRVLVPRPATVARCR